ncbi:hypothetical protein [Synechococcus sp. WH 5701]|nr:hypothetical protein [Synechococcus sp. WH 5701]EAQ74082.1 hypothetical protein WH5701_12248 [Synechococcus sp. WH 5701]
MKLLIALARKAAWGLEPLRRSQEIKAPQTTPQNAPKEPWASRDLMA